MPSLPVRRTWRPLLAVLILVSSSPAGEELFAPRHVAKLSHVTSVSISPDGRHLAYTRAVQRNPLEEENGRAYSELHVVDRQGVSRPFITGKTSVGGPRWTPDGRFIAFLDKRGDDEHTSLYLLPIDGGEARRAVAHDAAVHGPAFSPDGKQVAFLAAEPRAKQRREYIDKGFNQEIYEEDWRPTRVWIATLYSHDAARPLELSGSASTVHFSPAGRRLAVALAPTPSVDDSYMYKRISIIDVDTGKVVQQIANPGKLGQIGWSPDGQRLALISGVDIHDPRDGRLMVVDTPGDGTLRDLMPDYQAHVASFAWKTNDRLAWTAGQGTSSAVGQVDLEGSIQLRVDASKAGPVFSRIRLSSDGSTAALLGHSPTHPTEVFLLADGDDEPRRLTDGNPWLTEMRFARQETVTWQARDGLELRGVLVYPLNYRPGARYPLIMSVHGGPESHVSNGWITSYSRPGQVGAARGFAVFYPNYRGSTGRGVEFSKLGQADAAGGEFDDIVDAIDHLAEIGLVDPDKVGITGGSYGGYASAWGTTYYSDRYAAAVMFVGISNNISKLGTTDIPEEMFLVHHLKRLWDDWDYFLARSPIHYVQRNRTPTLILHGKNDPRVHPSQSLELFRHLKTLDQAPVRLVWYPGEGHGNRLAAARFDYSLRLMRWMEYYLQGPGGPAPDYEIDYAKEFER